MLELIAAQRQQHVTLTRQTNHVQDMHPPMDSILTPGRHLRPLRPHPSSGMRNELLDLPTQINQCNRMDRITDRIMDRITDRISRLRGGVFLGRVDPHRFVAFWASTATFTLHESVGMVTARAARAAKATMKMKICKRKGAAATGPPASRSPLESV